jgi:hypothetical protein
LTMHFAFFVLTFINITVCESFKPHPMSFIIQPLAFIDSLIVIGYNSFAMSKRIYNLSSIHWIFVTFNCKIILKFEFFPIQQFIFNRYIIQIHFFFFFI